MATFLHDIGNAAILVPTVCLGAATSGNTAGTTSNTTAGLAYGDFINGDGVCNALLTVGVQSGASPPALDCKIQESTDGTTWTDVTGASFTQITDSATNNKTQALNFQRTKRYLRGYLTIAAGATTRPVTVFLTQQRKFAS
jgi:hypothetical protein